MAKLNSGFKRWSLDCHDVSVEIMEDLGVSVLEDEESSKGSCSVEDKPTPEVHLISKVPEPVKRKEPCSPIYIPMEFSEDDQSNDSFLISKRMRVEGPPGTDVFSRLSDEVVLCIFKWLPKSTVAKCAQVAKRWKRLAYDEVLWRRLDLSGTCLKSTILGTVLMRGTQVLRLAKTEVCSKVFNQLFK